MKVMKVMEVVKVVMKVMKVMEVTRAISNRCTHALYLSLHHLITSSPHHVHFSINRKNSARVRASSRKPPSILLVTIETPRLCTPRVVMH